MDKLVIKPASVHEHADRHVWIEGTLLFINVQDVRNQERSVILHAHVNDIADGGKLNVVRIRVGRTVDCIIKAQCPVFVFFTAKQKAEQTVLVFAVDHCHPVAPPYQVLCRIAQM